MSQRAVCVVTPGASGRDASEDDVARAWRRKLGARRLTDDTREARFLYVRPHASAYEPRLGVLVRFARWTRRTPPRGAARGPRWCCRPDRLHDIGAFAGTRLRFQRVPYTPAGLLALAPQHRSALEPTDLGVLVRLARAFPARVFWWSGPHSGATQYHLHFQGHLRTGLGGVLPIEAAPRTPLLRTGPVSVVRVEGYYLPALGVTIGDDVAPAVEIAQACVAELHAACNLIAVGRELVIVGRRQAVASGLGKRLGGAEVAGVFVFSAEPPGAIRYDGLAESLAEVGLSRAEQLAWEARVLERLTEPLR